MHPFHGVLLPGGAQQQSALAALLAVAPTQAVYEWQDGAALLVGSTAEPAVGATSFSNELEATQFTASATGVIRTLESKSGPTASTNTQLLLGVYSDSAGAPGTLLGGGRVYGIPATNTWVTVDNLWIPITAGTVYWLATYPLGGDYVKAYTSGTGTQNRYTNGNKYPTLPNTWTSDFSWQNAGMGFRARGISAASGTRPVPAVSQSFTGSAYANPDSITIDVGQEEFVHGPDSLMDSPFVTTRINEIVRGYIGNNSTLMFKADSVDNLFTRGAVIAPGAAAAYDECGAWLTNAEHLGGGAVRSWYHAERMGGTGSCNYATTFPLKSVALAVSSDSGETWTKVGQVLTNPNAGTWDGTTTVGEGDNSVVKFGTDWYMFYNPTNPWGISVAKATVVSQGDAGDWLKWNGTSFANAGLGGASTILSNITGTHVKKLGASELMAVSNNMQGIPGTSGGLYVSFSQDATTWVKRTNPIATIPAGIQYGYASLVALDGGETLGNIFWLFYMHRIVASNARYLARRLIRMA